METVNRKPAALGEGRTGLNENLNSGEYIKKVKEPRIAEVIPFVLPALDDDEIAPLITPGIYELMFVKKAWTGFLHGRCPKVALQFRIVTEGPFFGKCVNQWHNVAGFDGRGRVIPKRGISSKYVNQYFRLFGRVRRVRDMGLGSYRGKVFRGEVKTVTCDSKQQARPEHMQYSIVTEILEVIVGSL